MKDDDHRFLALNLPMEQYRDHIICGDALAELRKLPDGFIQSCVTSPPYYGLRDYGMPDQIGMEETPDVYVERLVAVFHEVRRVLRPDGVLFLNLGDAYVGYKGDHYNEQGRRGTGEPNATPRCHMIGTPQTTGIPAKNLLGMPWRVALALQQDGWILRANIIWDKGGGTQETVTDRPTRRHEDVFLFSKQPRYFYQDTPEGRYSLWHIAPTSSGSGHEAEMPEKLVERCLLLGSCPGDVILDCFMGSGTVAMVALQHHRAYLGIELNPEYVTLIEERLAAIQPTLWIA